MHTIRIKDPGLSDLPEHWHVMGEAAGAKAAHSAAEAFAPIYDVRVYGHRGEVVLEARRGGALAPQPRQS